jgi:hypothetical protein
MATIKCVVELGEDRTNVISGNTIDEVIARLISDHTMSAFEHGYFISKGNGRLNTELASGWYVTETTKAPAAWVEQAKRIAELEAKLALAIEALENISQRGGMSGIDADDALNKIRSE